MSKTVLPYNDTSVSKKQQVASMFDKIAWKYDFLNRFLSMGIDVWWRKKAIKSIKAIQPKAILDIATGTADLAIAAMKLKPDHVTGVDISEEMLCIGRKKIEKKGLADKISLAYGDSENLQFEDNNFDAATVAFGVRNFEDLEAGLKEIHRVLRKDGQLAVLELSKPTMFPLKQLFNFYFKQILPFIGKFFSKDNRAYTYLPESVNAFPDGARFKVIMEKTGFKNVTFRPLTFGICTLYHGTK